MSRVVSLFIGFVCALLFVNVCSQSEDFGILLPDGSYKPDSFLTFGKVLRKLEDFTLPSGDAMLEKWIASLGKTNTLLKAGDLKAAVNVGHDVMPVLRGILPAIPDKIIYAAIESLPKRFEADLDGLILSGTTTLADVDKFIKFASETMLSAMSKTTPTAETLN